MPSRRPGKGAMPLVREAALRGHQGLPRLRLQAEALRGLRRPSGASHDRRLLLGLHQYLRGDGVRKEEEECCPSQGP